MIKEHLFGLFLAMSFFRFSAYSQWTEILNPSDHTLYSVDIHESGLCYAAGIGMIRSYDFGVTWEQVVFTGPSAIYFESVVVNSIEVVNASVIVGVGWYPFDDRPVIIRSVDNGLNWTVQWQGPAGSGKQIRDVEFYDESLGVAVGDAYTLRTTDGGVTWTSTGGTASDSMYGVTFLSASTVIVVGDNRILRSTNGGASYVLQSTPLKRFKSVGYDPLSNKVQAVYVKYPTTDTYARTSYDNGVTWTEMLLNNDQVICNEVRSNDTVYYGYLNSFRISYNNGQDNFSFTGYPFESVNDITFKMGTGLAVAGIWTESEIYRYDASAIPEISQIVDFTVEDSICEGVSTTHITSHEGLDSYEWIVDGVTVSTGQDLIYSYPTAGIHAVKLVTGYNGHMDTVTKAVTVIAQPVVTPFNFVGPLAVCSGTSFSFTVQNIAGQTGFKVFKNGVPINFYSSSGNNRTYSGGALTAPANFEIIKWRINECDSVAITETHVVNVEPYASIAENFYAVDSYVCSGDSTLIVLPDPNPGYNYSLFQGALLTDEGSSTSGDTIFLQSNPIYGPVNFTVKCASPLAGCQVTLSSIEPVLVDSAVADFDVELGYFVTGDTITIDATNSVGHAFNWLTTGSPGIFTNSNTLYPAIQYNTTGYYDLTLIAESEFIGCIDTLTKPLTLFSPAPDSIGKEVCWAGEEDLPLYVLEKHVDDFGNLIVVGYDYIVPSWPYPRFGATIQKYDAEGTLLWAWTHPLPPTIDDKHGSMFGSVTSDAQGNLYITGIAHAKEFQYADTVLFQLNTGPYPRNTFVMKLNPDGDFQWWINNFYSAVGSFPDIVWDRYTGNLYYSSVRMAGNTNFTSGTLFSPINDLKIVAIDAAGNYLNEYASTFESAGLFQPYSPSGMVHQTRVSPELYVGTDSILYVMGETDEEGDFGDFHVDPLGKRAAFVAKLNINPDTGPVEWTGATATAIFVPEPLWWDTPVVSNTIDRENNIYQSINWDIEWFPNPELVVTVIGNDTIWPVNGYKGSNIFKYDADLNYQWQKSFEPTYIRDILIANNSDVYFIGHMAQQFAHFEDSTPVYLLPHEYENNLFVGSMNTNGTLQWLEQIGQTYLHFGHPLGGNSCGDIYISGQCRTSMFYTHDDQDFNFSLNNVDYGTFHGDYMFKLTDSVCVSGGCNTLCLDTASFPDPSITYSPTALSTAVYVDYQWFFEGDTIPGATSSAYMYLQNGNYSVTVTDANGCKGTGVLLLVCNPDYVTLPTITDTGSSLTTENFSSYQWYLEDIAIPGATAQSYTYTTNGNYKVEITDSLGCTAIGSLVETCLDSSWMILPVISIDNDLILAESGFSAYQWLLNGDTIPGATLDAYMYLQNGNYGVLVTDTNGCEGIALLAETCLNPDFASLPVISFDNTTLFAAGPFSSYQWYLNGDPILGATSQLYNHAENGSYSVEVTDSLGCSVIGSLAETCLNPAWMDIQPIQITDDFLSAETGFSAYQWFFDGTSIPGANSPNYQFNQDGMYYVQVTDSNGCVGMSDTVVIFGLQVRVNENPEGMKIFPNPSQEFITIQFSFVPDVTALKIMDFTGKICEFSVTHQAEKSELFIDISELTSGIYLVEYAQSNSVKIVQRLIKL